MLLYLSGLNWWISEIDFERTLGVYGLKDFDFSISPLNGKSNGRVSFTLFQASVLLDIIRDLQRQS